MSVPWGWAGGGDGVMLFLESFYSPASMIPCPVAVYVYVKISGRKEDAFRFLIDTVEVLVEGQR